MRIQPTEVDERVCCVRAQSSKREMKMCGLGLCRWTVDDEEGKLRVSEGWKQARRSAAVLDDGGTRHPVWSCYFRPGQHVIPRSLRISPQRC